MNGANVVLTCQRTDCDATEVIEVDLWGPLGTVAYSLADVLQEEWPEGWGYDFAGVNVVLHCPEHRSAEEASS